MNGSTFGERFRVTTWGESHGAGIGAVVDGCPAGVEIDEEANSKRGEDICISTPDSKVKVFVIPTNEELVIARDTKEIAG